MDRVNCRASIAGKRDRGWPTSPEVQPAVFIDAGQSAVWHQPLHALGQSGYSARKDALIVPMRQIERCKRPLGCAAACIAVNGSSVDDHLLASCVVGAIGIGTHCPEQCPVTVGCVEGRLELSGIGVCVRRASNPDHWISGMGFKAATNNGLMVPADSGVATTFCVVPRGSEVFTAARLITSMPTSST